MPLKPSDRVKLLKAISSRLDSEEWQLIDVTLQQFGLPTNESWGGEKSAYVLRMAANASDAALVDLGQYVGFTLSGPGTQVLEPSFWKKDSFRLFVCHLATKKGTATKLQEALEPFGITSFVAHKDIVPTAEWLTEIELALATCDTLMALMHEGFHESTWTDQEIGFAMGRGVPVFAVKFDQDPYGFIGKFQAFNGNGKTADELAAELFHAYRRNKQTQARIAEVLMSLFAQSPSFAEAKKRIGYLEELTYWDPSFVSRIKAAAESNSQIVGSWGVPERAAKLAEKWHKGS